MNIDAIQVTDERAFGGELRSGKAQDYTSSHLLRDKIVSGPGYFEQRRHRLAGDTAAGKNHRQQYREANAGARHLPERLWLARKTKSLAREIQQGSWVG